MLQVIYLLLTFHFLLLTYGMLGKLLPLIVAIFICNAGYAQRTQNVDSVIGVPTNAFYTVGGNPFVNVKFARVVEGTPFFVEHWTKGTVITLNNEKFTDIEMRVNLADNQIHYMKNGIEYVSDRRFREIILDDMKEGKRYSFKPGYPGVPHATDKTFFQVLADGNVTLLKQIRKVVSDRAVYGAATVEQVIGNVEVLYIYKDGNMIKLKKEKESILEPLVDQKQKLDEFIQQNKLKFKSEDDIVKLVTFYNSLNSTATK